MFCCTIPKPKIQFQDLKTKARGSKIQPIIQHQLLPTSVDLIQPILQSNRLFQIPFKGREFSTVSTHWASAHKPILLHSLSHFAIELNSFKETLCEHYFTKFHNIAEYKLWHQYIKLNLIWDWQIIIPTGRLNYNLMAYLIIEDWQ